MADLAEPADGAGDLRIVVAGAGFAGLTALSELARLRRRHRWPARSRVRVTLVDRNAYSTFQPLLYQVATAGLTAADVAYPAWTAVRKAGAHLRKGEITGLDTDRRQLLLRDGSVVGYDYLVLATGVSAAFFGVTGAAENALSLYTRRDAIILRDQLMTELERRSAPGDTRDLNITVAGGGATGVELAGTLAELRNIALPEITEVATAHVRIASGDRGRGDDGIPDEEMPSDVTVWAAGVAAPEWIGKLGLPTGRGGRLRAGSDLRVAGQDRVFAAGDIAIIDGDPQPQLAQPAIQHGRHAATQISRLASGLPTQPFRYKDKGIMATIGHRSAVVELPSRIRARGTLAWLAWLALHLVTLLGGRNRISALVNLSWRYLTWSRGGGVIVGDDPGPAIVSQDAMARRETIDP